MSQVLHVITFISTIIVAVLAINRDGNTPVPTPEPFFERDPRQYGLYPTNSGIEPLAMGLMIAISIGIIAIPLIILLFTLFGGIGYSGFGAPNYGNTGYGTTTTVSGRKKRSIQDLIGDHPLGDKLLDIIQRYMSSTDKMSYLKTIIQ